MKLKDFIGKHQGETAWIFGKGKSLEGFDFKQADGVRCAINDVVQYVPNCKYAFANDGVQKWRDVYAKGQILFQTDRALGEFDSTVEGALPCDVVTYPDTRNDLRLSLSRAELAELPTVRRGTLGSAIQILHIMGFARVYAVGIDGGTYHAKGFTWRTRLRTDHGKDYNAIRSSAIDTAAILGIDLIFYNPDKEIQDMQPNGKVFVRFLKNAFAQQLPYAIGEIASFAPHVVKELIACRAAEIFTPPAKQEPIISTAKIEPVAEKSAVFPAKRGRKPNK